MNYTETIRFLFSSLPMYQRIGDKAIRKDLTNIRLLCNLLGNPQDTFQTIHVAGTNGKGSTSHMLASVFQASGKRVGLYTSPHYVDFRERIKINGKWISKKYVIDFVAHHHEKWDAIQPSFFEITVAMAFDYFKRKKVDIAIIETGLGGRLDSTNIIHPRLSVITNIGFDHMQMLGNTLPEIAEEKAGIIKLNTPVVIGEWQAKTYQVFTRKAASAQAPLMFASRKVDMGLKNSFPDRNVYDVFISKKIWLKSLSTDLTGPYQERNIKTVLGACLFWNKNYPDEMIKTSDIKDGLRHVLVSTNMIGRWMVIRRKPLVITDAAHNEDGMKTIIPSLLKLRARSRHFVLGFVADKEVAKILRLFPRDANYYWCTPAIPRGKPVTETCREGSLLGLKGQTYSTVAGAYKAALSASDPGDMIFVGGSSYVVGNFLEKV